MSRKGKSRTRQARTDIMKANERNDRRKARQQAKAKSYDRQAYDKPASEET